MKLRIGKGSQVLLAHIRLQLQSLLGSQSLDSLPVCPQGVLAPGLPGAMLAAGADAASPLYRAVVRIQSRYRGYAVRKVSDARHAVHPAPRRLDGIGMAAVKGTALPMPCKPHHSKIACMPMLTMLRGQHSVSP